MKHDAIVIGGSFAGLSAALYIARACRSVCVIDAGRPRNRFATASHGLFGQDGGKPLEMIATARAQLQLYPTVRFLSGQAAQAEAIDGGFEVRLENTEAVRASALVLAYGVTDILPDLPGLSERWGRSVLHCPYCHGYEFAGQRLGVLQSEPLAVHRALHVADWGPVTLFLNGGDAPDTQMQDKLIRRGVQIEPARITSLQGEGRDLSGLLMEDERVVPLEALFVGVPVRMNSTLAEDLGCLLDEGPFGPLIRTDARKLTTVPGIYAAGDIARAPHSAGWAAADGMTAGVSLHQDLIFKPLAA
ncbi:MAG: NAD(P)/FAD-dependent oxidoreductase [Xanthobacter sp.]